MQKTIANKLAKELGVEPRIEKFGRSTQNVLNLGYAIVSVDDTAENENSPCIRLLPTVCLRPEQVLRVLAILKERWDEI